MAGGKGTRLAPFTTILPKPLMPVDDQPILEVVIRQLRHFGFHRITISVGHLAELIMAFFGKGERWDVNIQYAVEDEPQGTMGALRNICLPDEPFLVMNGDVLTDLDFRALFDDHESSDALMTVAVVRRHVDVSLGVLEFDDDCRVTAFREKPQLPFNASMGIYILDPKIRKLMPSQGLYGFDQLVLDMLRTGAPPRVHLFDGRWLDIGRKEDYEVATETFRIYRRSFLRDEAAPNEAVR
jgi:NDP-sugar pyrophosphorylase family protein